jgi:hypothetical protein
LDSFPPGCRSDECRHNRKKLTQLAQVVNEWNLVNVDTETIKPLHVADPPPPLALIAPAVAVARDLQIQVKIGNAIREHRLRDHRDLEIARQEKQEWVQRCNEVLTRSFNHAGAAELFNNWAAPILPEYAEFGLFVELFNEEMRHRLNQLKVIAKSLRGMQQIIVCSDAPSMTKGTEMVSEATINATSPSSTNAVTATAPTITQAMHAAQAAAALRTQATRATGSRSSSEKIAGLLIVRTGDDAACDAVRQFVEQLGLSLHVSKPAAHEHADPNHPDASGSATPLLNELSAMQTAPASFALLFTDAPNQPMQSSDGDALFDLGCCVGRLGSSRVIVLHRTGEPHTDRFGLSHIVFDAFDGWRLQLARHLKRAGVEVDLNKLV